MGAIYLAGISVSSAYQKTVSSLAGIQHSQSWMALCERFRNDFLEEILSRRRQMSTVFVISLLVVVKEIQG